MKYINFTSSNQPFGWMGNMCSFWENKPLKVVYMGKEYPTTEHLFQSLRFENHPKIQTEIRLASNGYRAKMVSKAHNILYDVKPLTKKDVENMMLCVELKIEQHSFIKDMLKETKDLIIYEDVSSRIGDSKSSSLFWGAAKIQDMYWVGMNVLGKIWMFYRTFMDSPNKEELKVDFINKLL